MPVLVTSRALSAVPWVLVYTVSYEEALGAAEARFKTLTAVLFLTVGLIAVIIAAVWYYGSSRRASQAAYQFNQMAQKFQEQSDLLQLVTDSQPTSIFILDKDDKYRFANRQAAKDAGIAATEMVGKPISNVLGPAAAKRIIRLNHQAMEEKPHRHRIRTDRGRRQAEDGAVGAYPAERNLPACFRSRTTSPTSSTSASAAPATSISW